MIRVRSMGDNYALLTPREGDTMEELIQLNREWFDNIFVRMEPWSAAFATNHRVVWVRCFGLPISLWNRDCFAKLLGEEARLIDIDNATLLWDNLEYARMKVRIKKDWFVKTTKIMRINNQSFSIALVEEEPAAQAGLCKGYHRLYTDSDSISSVETYVEESAFSVKSDEEEQSVKVGEDSRAKGKEVGEGREEGEAVQKSKVSLVENSSSSRACQGKSGKTFTKEEIQIQMAFTEPTFVVDSVEACVSPLLKPCAHAELAKLVVDIERGVSHNEKNIRYGP